MKNVLISLELFNYLVAYHLCGEKDYEEEIQNGLEEKLEAMQRRELYSKYKTAPEKAQREEARQEYLDSRGVPEDYRWTVSPCLPNTGAWHAPVFGRQGESIGWQISIIETAVSVMDSGRQCGNTRCRLLQGFRRSRKLPRRAHVLLMAPLSKVLLRYFCQK